MSKTRYAFRINMYGSEADPQAMGEYLEQLIDEKNEHVTYDEIVAAAKKNGSPIKECFTWDENEAADKWRKKEAKVLVNNFHTANSKGERQHTRAFVYVHHPEHEGKRVILTTRSAMARPEMREQVVEQAVRNLQRSLTYWGSAYGGNSQLRALAKDVEKLKRRAERELMLTTV